MLLSRYFTIGFYTEKKEYVPLFKATGIYFEDFYLKDQVTIIAFYKTEGILDKPKASAAPKDYFLCGELIEVFYDANKKSEVDRFIIKTPEEEYVEVKLDEKGYNYVYKSVSPVQKTVTAWE